MVKIENNEKKKEIMKNKYKLKGEKIFIENDLSQEERKTQEKINRQTKEKKEKGEEVKVGMGRVKINGKIGM